jgi:hypothetical protein
VALALALRDLGDLVARGRRDRRDRAGRRPVVDRELLAVLRVEPREERRAARVPFVGERDPQFQYSSGLNASISRSRSTMSRSATLCTRPADSPNASLLQTSADTSYPTMRSRTRRARCAS